MSGYLKYEFPVIEADNTGREAALEIWASPEESEYVELALTSSAGYVSMGLEPGVALQLADALEARAPVEAPGLDDYDDSPAKLHVSWDDEGADLLLLFTHQRIRVVIDYDQQPPQLAEALRECAAELGAATTS